MTERSRVWDGTATGDATAAPYDAATEFAQVLISLAGAGGIPTDFSAVFAGELNELAATGVASPVAINTGRALTYGAWYENDASLNVAIPTPAALTRIDRIVLRKSWAAQTVRITRIAGVEGGAAPALTQLVGTTWDEPLWQVSITVGGVITLTDQRQFANTAGVMSTGVPGNSAIGDAAAAGTSRYASHLDHKHGREAAAIAGASAVGDTAATGSGPTVSYSDHRHAREAFAAPSNLAPGIAASTGVATTIPHSDHVHAVVVPLCRVYNSANESLTSGVDTAITYDSERFDNDTMHDTASNTSRLVAKTAGKYLMTACVRFAANATGQRSAAFRLNGSTYLVSNLANAAAAGVTDVNVTCVYDMAINDYVEVIANQSSGGALNVTTQGNISPEAEMAKIGA